MGRFNLIFESVDARGFATRLLGEFDVRGMLTQFFLKGAILCVLEYILLQFCQKKM